MVQISKTAGPISLRKTLWCCCCRPRRCWSMLRRSGAFSERLSKSRCGKEWYSDGVHVVVNSAELPGTGACFGHSFEFRGCRVLDHVCSSRGVVRPVAPPPTLPAVRGGAFPRRGVVGAAGAVLGGAGASVGSCHKSADARCHRRRRGDAEAGSGAAPKNCFETAAPRFWTRSGASEADAWRPAPNSGRLWPDTPLWLSGSPMLEPEAPALVRFRALRTRPTLGGRDLPTTPLLWRVVGVPCNLLVGANQAVGNSGIRSRSERAASVLDLRMLKTVRRVALDGFSVPLLCHFCGCAAIPQNVAAASNIAFC